MNEHRQTPANGDEALDDLVRDLASDYHQPPGELSAAKREEMWNRIQATRGSERRPRFVSPRARKSDGAGTRITQILWPVAAAAILLLGIAIGRQTSGPGVAEVDTGEGGTTPSIGLTEHTGVEAGLEGADEGSPRGRSAAAEEIYRLAARRYLTRTDALLTEFRQAAVAPTPGAPSGGSGVTPPTLGWAGDLLLETRLLQDSPLGRNPELGRLLSDLELILAQIVQMADEASPRERELIRQSIEKRSLLFRVREEIPARDDLTGA